MSANATRTCGSAQIAVQPVWLGVLEDRPQPQAEAQLTRLPALQRLRLTWRIPALLEEARPRDLLFRKGFPSLSRSERGTHNAEVGGSIPPLATIVPQPLSGR